VLKIETFVIISQKIIAFVCRHILHRTLKTYCTVVGRYFLLTLPRLISIFYVEFQEVIGQSHASARLQIAMRLKRIEPLKMNSDDN